MFKLIALFVLASVSPAFAQDEEVNSLTLTIQWPQGAGGDVRVTVLPEGGNCPEVMEGSAEESAMFDRYGGLSWYNSAVTTTPLLVSEVYTVCTYQVRNGVLHYVPLSIFLDKEYDGPTYSYTPVLPKPPDPPVVAEKAASQWQWTKPVLYLGEPLLVDSTGRLYGTGGGVLLPPQLRVHEDIALGLPIYIGGTYDLVARDVTPNLALGLMVQMHLVDPKTKLALDAGVSLMSGRGSYLLHCDLADASVTSIDAVAFDCGSQGSLTARMDGWWVGPTLSAALTFPVGKQGQSVGFGAWWFCQLYNTSWPIMQERVLQVEYQGQQTEAPFTLRKGENWHFRAPVMPSLVVRF